MLANVVKKNEGYMAQFEREYSKSAAQVWNALVDNNNFKYWMDHLEITDLSKGGNINFHYNDGSGQLEQMKILDFEPEFMLEFEWGEDRVRFEVHADENDTKLIMKEFIHKLTDHTPKDLAGWHVCLMRFGNLVNHQPDELPEKEWEKWYEEYQKVVVEFRESMI